MRALFISGILGLLPLAAFAQYRGMGHRSSPFHPASPFHSSSPFTPAAVGPAGIPTSVVPGTALYGLPGTTVPPGTALYGLPALTAPRPPVYTRRGGGYGHGGGHGGVPFYGSVALPYYGWGDDMDVSAQPLPPVDSTTQVLANEIDKLTEQVQQLTAERQAQASQAPAFEPEGPAAQVQTVPPEPSTILVLRDGKKVETDNYAVMGATFWNFSAHPVQRIPIAQIDVSASRQANELRGIEFPALSQSATQ